MFVLFSRSTRSTFPRWLAVAIACVFAAPISAANPVAGCECRPPDAVNIDAGKNDALENDAGKHCGKAGTTFFGAGSSNGTARHGSVSSCCSRRPKSQKLVRTEQSGLSCCSQSRLVPETTASICKCSVASKQCQCTNCQCNSSAIPDPSVPAFPARSRIESVVFALPPNANQFVWQPTFNLGDNREHSGRWTLPRTALQQCAILSRFRC